MAKKVNALDAFLSAEIDTVETVYIKRLNTEIEVKALTGDEFDRVTQQSKDADGEVNQMKMNAAIIAAAAVSPKFSDAALREKYGVPTGADVVQKALLAGEIARTVKKVIEISGFTDDIEEVKN